MTDKALVAPIKRKTNKNKIIFNPTLVQAICEAIKEGYSVQAIDKQLGICGERTIYRELRVNESFCQEYARAHTEQASRDAEKIRIIAENCTSETYTRDRLEIDSLKWLASKRDPKKYGDKMQVDNKHDVTGDLKKMLQERFKAEEI